MVLAGFVVGLVCSFVGAQIEGPFGPLVSLRVAIGSATAFLVGQLLDVAVFNRLRAGSWWRAPFVSSVDGQRPRYGDLLRDRLLGRLAFIAPQVDVGWANEAVPLLGRGPAAPLWVWLALADFSVKFAIAVFALAPFRARSAGTAAARRIPACVLPRPLARLAQLQPAKGGDPMSSETLEREAGFSGGTA